MQFEDFIAEFRNMEARLQIELDDPAFATLCEMIEQEGLKSWDGGSILHQAETYHDEYPYVGRSDFDTNDVSCWRGIDGVHCVRAAEVYMHAIDEGTIDEAAALLGF